MKEKFISKKFNDDQIEIIQCADDICQNYASQGYDLSLRQLYYQFVSRQPLSYEWLNTESNYKKLGNIISDARNAGFIDWSHISDRGRKTVINSHWNTPADILYSAASSFRIDLWKNQPNFVMIMVEKQALEGILQPVCEKLDIAFVANKGYASDSLMYSIGKTIEEKWESDKTPHIIYLGDHDPSGIDMTRDVEDRLNRYSRAPVRVHRIALNMDQVNQYNPPENPTKLTDSRAKSYICQFGESCWELDALEPSVLASMVMGEVIHWRNQKLYEHDYRIQSIWKEELKSLAKNYEG